MPNSLMNSAFRSYQKSKSKPEETPIKVLTPMECLDLLMDEMWGFYMIKDVECEVISTKINKDGK